MGEKKKRGIKYILTKEGEEINDETINFIEAEAYKIIETYFVRI